MSFLSHVCAAQAMCEVLMRNDFESAVQLKCAEKCEKWLDACTISALERAFLNSLYQKRKAQEYVCKSCHQGMVSRAPCCAQGPSKRPQWRRALAVKECKLRPP